MENSNWTDNQIDVLLERAKAKFDTELPLADEIRHIKHFIWEMRVMAAKRDRFLLQVTYMFQWWHFPWTRVEEIKIPEPVAWKVLHEAVNMLNSNCDRLAEITGIDKKTLKE